MPDQHEKLLERYELQARIAVGGMAEVYRAKAFGAHGFEKDLAIKRILPELAQDPEFEQRFIGEAKLAVKLSHANVVQVLDFGKFGETLFIAMEYVDGLDLAALLRRYRDREQRIPIPAALQIAVEIARGLEFAHQHGVVHRDVSPSNILLSRAGEVKIADFGIAQAVTDKQQRSDRRKIMGKWRYMSPEQTRGEALSTRSDLFSAASVMYELFTGEKLFGGDQAEDIIRSIHDMPIPKASARRPGVPTHIDEILAKALQRRPADRPVKAAEMLRELIEVSYESTIVATALDVADAVDAVIDDPATGSSEYRLPAGVTADRGIDALIRQQIGGAIELADTQRKTAISDPAEQPVPDPDSAAGDEFEHPGGQTGATMVRRGVDAEGVTIWDVDGNTLAAAPQAIRSGRRPTRPPPAEGELATPSARRHPVSAGVWIGAAAAIALVAAAATWARSGASHGDDGDRTGGAAVDARSAEPASAGTTQATLYIESVPQGATILINGVRIDKLTPTEVVVEPDRPHRIDITLEGHLPGTDEVVPRSGERVRVRSVLTPLACRLEVTTRPPGATVTLDGEAIGTTPLARDDLPPGSDRVLVIEKADHFPIKLVVNLEPDRDVVINKRMKSSIELGRINLSVKDDAGGRSWADVYFRGKNIGQAPGTLQLPVGKQSLRLVNPQTKKTAVATVNVYGDRVETYAATLRGD